MKKTATLVCALTLAAGAQAACYTVMGPRGQILSETSTPPVDMRYQLHQTVPYKYGRGASMVFGIADNNCGPEIDPYYDLMPTQVVYREGRRARVRQACARRGATASRSSCDIEEKQKTRRAASAAGFLWQGAQTVQRPHTRSG